MKTAQELWRTVSRQGLKPLPKTSVSEWADNYRILSNNSAEPGKWKTSRAPYQKEIMDAFTQPGIHRVVVKSSSQVGKSDVMNNVIGRFAHLDPATIMMVQPTIEMAMDYSKSRISPMLRDTKVLSNLFHEVKTSGDKSAKTRDGNNTILSKIFPGGRLIMCGANSPAGLASRPVRILLCDEVDRFPDSAGTEGDPVDLAAKRMTTFWNRVMGLFSTPTNEGASRIDAEYLAGTQEEWQVRCPGCGEYHLLRYTDMVTDNSEVKDTGDRVTVIVHDVRWRCPDCGHDYTERQMKRSPQRYVAQNKAALANGIRSFFVNAFYSPWITWAEIMREWLEAKGDPSREQVVVNTRFGESYRQPGAFEDHMMFMRRREAYGAELPDGVLLLTAAVDTQDNRLEYEICGWGDGEECWGIKKGVIYGVPDHAETWAELDKVLDKQYHFKDGTGLKVSRTFIDSGGHYSLNVYEYSARNLVKQRIAIRGVGGPGVPILYKIARDNKSRYNVPIQQLGTNDGKQSLMNRLTVNEPGALYCHFPLDETEYPARGYDEIYFKGIISEHKAMKKKNGQLYEVWETTQGVRNEPLDLRVYNIACMMSIPHDWEILRAAISGEEEEKILVRKKPIKKRKRSVASRNIW